MSAEPEVVELEFLLEGGELALGRAARATGADLEVELAAPRSDGSVLAYVSATGGPSARVLRHLRADDDVSAARRYDRGDGALFELVMAGAPVTVVADAGAVVTQLSAGPEEGRLVADVPAHVDASAVIERFVAAHPTAQLVARRRTDRPTPQLGQSQFVTRVLATFTERQLHALRVAYDAGYFEWPRDAKADDVADRLGVSTPTFSQHLRAAERKLTRVLFEG
jgi:predicted DNA-binding protein (UPF0251 family)